MQKIYVYNNTLPNLILKGLNLLNPNEKSDEVFLQNVMRPVKRRKGKKVKCRI